MRIIESTTISGLSGKDYRINIYPSDMRFNDFIAGVYILFADDRTLYADHSDNVDLVLQKKQVATSLEGLSKIGLIRMGNPDKRQTILDDLDLDCKLKAL